MFFRACIGRDACNEDGDHCRACGRTHEEIAKTRMLVTGLVDFMNSMDYENYEEFLEYIRRKAKKKFEHQMNKE